MRTLFCLLAAVGVAGICVAQQDMGYITGRVVDPSAAVVPEASILVVEQNTGDRTLAVSTPTGNYTAGPLKVGTYRITVQKQGFRSAVAENVGVHAQDRVRLDFALEVGQIAESIAVTADTPLLQTENAALGQAVDTREVRELPLNGRNFQQLGWLAAGVVPAVGASRDMEAGFNSHGQRVLQNNFIIDGVDNNSYMMGLDDRKSQVMVPSLDAVQEFKIETSNYSAEFGSKSGAVMNVSVKSGTNQYHGSAYEYIRNDIFDSRQTFNYVDRDGDGKADPEPLRQNQFGATFGGPLRRNRTFYFGSWEGTRIRHAQSFLRTVPTPNEKRGIFDERVVGVVRDPVANAPFPNNTVPESRWDPVARGLIKLWPDPNFAGSGTRANYTSGPPWRETADQVDTRGDHNFSDSDKLFVRFSLKRYQERRDPPLPLPGRGNVDWQWADFESAARTAALSYTKVITPTLVGEFRFGFRRLRMTKSPLTKERLAEQFGFKGLGNYEGVTGLPGIAFAGRIGYENLGEVFDTTQFKVSQGYQYLENLTWIHGSHTVKVGSDISFNRSDVFSGAQAIGQFQFNGRYTNVSLADFYLGMVNQVQVSNLSLNDMRFRKFMFHVQDDWKATPRLTLNFGLRYELHSPLYDKFNRTDKLNLESGPDFGKLIYAASRGDSWSDRALINTDINNFAPRVGLAYRMGEKWTFRGGVGVFYGGEEAEGVNNRMVRNWPFHVRYLLLSTPAVPAVWLSQGLAPGTLDPGSSLPAGITLNQWDTNFPLPEIYQWNAGFQRQLNKSTVLKLAYVGSSSSHIIDRYNWNAPGIGNPATEAQRSVFPDLGALNFTTPLGHGTYHGIDAQVEKRFSRGFSFLTSYTWGHSIDNIEELWGPEGNGNQDKFNWAADKGSSGYDIRQRLVSSYMFELPFGSGRRWLNRGRALNYLAGGWQFSGITVMRSGLPYMPSLANAREALGTSAVGTWRPDRIGSGKVDNPTTDRWFDRTAFVRPCGAGGCRYGNAGRNILTAGGQINFDLGMAKAFQVREGMRVQFRAEVFNFFNTPAFAKPNASLDSPDVATVRATASSPRIMQFALRFEF